MESWIACKDHSCHFFRRIHAILKKQIYIQGQIVQFFTHIEVSGTTHVHKSSYMWVKEAQPEVHNLLVWAVFCILALNMYIISQTRARSTLGIYIGITISLGGVKNPQCWDVAIQCILAIKTLSGSKSFVCYIQGFIIAKEPHCWWGRGAVSLHRSSRTQSGIQGLSSL